VPNHFDRASGRPRWPGIDDTTKTIAKAFVSPDADDWNKVVCSEVDSIPSNGI
jgi:hypothetical protein